MINKTLLKQLAKEHGTPLFVIDHDQLRENLAEFNRWLPRVQPYYAVKANPDPEIVRTFYKAGASFDVASLPEFMLVYEHVKGLPAKERQDFIWDKIIYAHPIKANETLRALNKYKPLVTYDNFEEIKKVKKYAPNVGMLLRIRVPNTGAVVELSSKFGADPGEAVDLIEASEEAGITVEGLSFHVGSQTTNFQNYVQALEISAGIFKEARMRGFTKMNQLDIGGGFPAPYDANVKPLRELAKILNHEIARLFPEDVAILAEPGRYMVATACISIAEVIGKSHRDGKRCYYLNDGLYHTYSGVLFDHCHYPVKAFKTGPTEMCSVFGPTCDALDTLSMAEQLPELNLGDLVYSENMGAYTHASSTYFNGFPPAKVVHVNL
ncbi:MAG TPA: type III PLP-dependent enzyme [Holophaga sp.]|nr:type III PLP-dependent enzyme [Holophaga sp.]HPS67439.1 type III PLP-dependent enzyme [Holophaga sp.]